MFLFFVELLLASCCTSLSGPPRIFQQKWYQNEEVRFECTGCGDCCRVSGDVWLNGDEAKEVDGDVFDVRLEGGWRRLRQGSDGCIFLEDNKCSIHASRPLQCRAYPFWPRILSSKESWLAEPCEGIENVTSPTVVVDEIDANAEQWAAWLRRFPADQVAAVDDVEKWAALVADLNLCPWARPALDSMKFVCSQADTLQGTIAALEDASDELCSSKVADHLAITFVVLPRLATDDFLTFRDIIEHIEDHHLFQYDVQLAGFHPNWTWAEGDSSVDFEKRAPHPTISLVRRTAIEGAEHITEKIATDNQRTLEAIGADRLASKFASACGWAPSSGDRNGESFAREFDEVN